MAQKMSEKPMGSRRGPGMMGPRPKIEKGTFTRLFKYVIKRYKFMFLAVIVCLIISSIANAIGMTSMKTIIDEYVVPLIGDQNPDYSEFAKYMVRLACIFASEVLSVFIYSRFMAIIAQGVMKDIRNELFEKMQKLPIRYFDERTNGEIMSLYTNDVDTLQQMLSKSLVSMLESGLAIVTTFVAMLRLNIPLTLCVIVCTLFTVLAMKWFASRSTNYFIRQQESLAKVNGYVEEMMNGQKVIKVFTHEEKSKEEFDELNDILNDDMYNANKFANSLMPISGRLSDLGYVIVAIVGCIMALNSANSVDMLGTIVAFLTLTKGFSRPVTQVMNQFNSIIVALAGAGRVFKLMDEKPEEDEGNVTLVNVKKENGKIVEVPEYTGVWAWKYPKDDGTVEYVELKGHIELNNVTFGYTEEKEVLHDISLYAKPGQKIAFVGATGAGKTTITNLINRFYDIQKGTIKYDDIDIKQIKKDDLRRSLGMVLQDTNLFTGTIRENIRYGKPEASNDEVYEAAKLANADGFISRLPKGYDTMLTENGAQLSQGQRQLIAIARAAIANPPVMILDEATSSIDTRTEKLVQDGMDRLMDGRTVFVIAHRLSTVRNSKAIMVLDHGNIIERGEHDFLIEQKGTYYKLYTGAFELE